MYVDGLGMEVLGGFENHSGFDGTMVGLPGQSYHLEFTFEHGSEAEVPPSSEHMLVFYHPDEDEWLRASERMLKARFEEIPAHNPYWNQEGRTFKDLDGYLVVICHQEWTRQA